METFVQASQRRSRGPWIIAAVFAGLFAVWQLDAVPRIGVVATGTIDSPAESDSADAVSAAGGWDEIVDLGSGRSESQSATDLNDPLVVALNSEHEPLDLNPTGRGTDAGVVTDEVAGGTGHVRTASFEVPADSRPSSSPPVTVIPADLAQQLREIDQQFREGLVLEAHAALSQVYWKQPEMRSLIQARIEHTAALIYTSSDQVFGEPVLVQPGDTLGSIAAAHQVTWQYLSRLNRVAPERLQAGQQLKVLKGPFSAVVDLSDFALTIHAHGWFVHRYRIGIGRDNRTPTGEFVVEEKLENPVWYNPDGGQVEADDPENPLGEYWLGLGNHIGIHGTIDPESIGTAKSRGCLHLADADIEEVYHLLVVGSKVLIRP